jgi:hypothetical protein
VGLSTTDKCSGIYLEGKTKAATCRIVYSVFGEGKGRC